MEEKIWEDPRLWVAAAFAVFVLLMYKKIGAFVSRALDARSARIDAELSEARRLREEAQGILADYKQKQAYYVHEAEEMLKQARTDTDILNKNAEAELKTALEIRTKQALDKIAREEQQAIAEVRHHVVDIALAAAKAVIIDQVSHMSQDDLIRLAVEGIERKIH